MKKIIKTMVLLLTLSIMPVLFVVAATMIDPGTTTNFAILSGSTITNTGSTVINGNGGNVGLYPGTSIINPEGITTSGTFHTADSVASIAKDDLVTVFNQTAGALPVTTIPAQLGGQTLVPGVYVSETGAFDITGTLTLDALGDSAAIFIFKASSTLITASDSVVDFINDAQYCLVFWNVGSSATLGTNSKFAGRIMALTSITATTGATIEGQLLARNGAVTLDTNTITNDNCATIITVDGGELPDTATSLYQVLLFGTLLVVVGASSLVVRKIYEKNKFSK